MADHLATPTPLEEHRKLAAFAGEWTGEWLGTTMFFGHIGEMEALKCLVGSGLSVRHSSIEKQDNEQATFMWVDAAKVL